MNIRTLIRLSLGGVLVAALSLANAGCSGAEGEQEQDIADLDVAPVYNADPNEPLAGIDVTNESDHMEELAEDTGE